MDPSLLAREIADFLAESPMAVAIEDGVRLFDFAAGARYSLATERDKCVLQMWSEERNVVRRVVDLKHEDGALSLRVMRFGQREASVLELCADPDRRTASAKRSSRAAYQALLRRVLERDLPGSKIERSSTAPDLERSFGPAYARALVRRGQQAWAVVGVNAQELQATVDGALTVALLWLDHCRNAKHVGGLRLYLPRGMAHVIRERMAHLDHEAAAFELFELDERELRAEAVDCRDRGNIATRLVQLPNSAAALERFADAIAHVREHAPECDVVVLSAPEIAFRYRGLEFARARLAAEKGSFGAAVETVFGFAAGERVLDDSSEELFCEIVKRMLAGRHASGRRDDVVFRMQPERWLESLVVENVAAIDARLDRRFVYSQVPAFSASDRAMIDVLTCTRGGRLAVLELKADEDLHLPLQGLDYWARVRWHHERGEFKKFGYFRDRELSAEPPLLYLVAPALHVHPTTDALLRYLAPEIECELVGVDEHWREGVRVVFRKRREKRFAGDQRR